MEVQLCARQSIEVIILSGVANCSNHSQGHWKKLRKVLESPPINLSIGNGMVQSGIETMVSDLKLRFRGYN